MKHVTFHLVKNYWRPAESLERHHLTHRSGATLAVYLDELELCVDEVHLVTSGQVIQALPDMVYPLPGDHITISPRVAGGGGGGGKDVARAVAFVAVMVVAVVASVYGAPWLGAALGKEAFGLILLEKAIFVGVMAVGGMMVNALLPPASADVPQLGFSGDWSSSPTYGWDIRNSDQPGFAIPVIDGTHRVGGQMIARHVTTDGDKQYLNLLLAVSEGPVESITDIHVNDQPVANYKDVDTETKLGALDQTPVANFRNLYQDRPVDSLVSHGTPVTRQTQGTAVEGLEITLAFPRGLYVTSPGDLNSKTVSVQLEYREVGVGSWTGWDTVSITDNRSAALRRVFRKEGLAAGHYEVRVTRQTVDDGSREQSTLYWSLLTEITTDDLAYPGVALVGLKLLATDQLSGGMPTITSLVNRGDITVKEGDGTPHVVSSDNPAWAAWDILNNPRYGAGISHAMLDYDAFESWADWCDELVPDGAGGTEKRCTFNIVLDAQMTVFEAASKACAAGRAGLVTVGSKYSVVVDRATTPTNLYAAGNILADSLEITYLPMNGRSREIEVQFANPLKEYRRDTLSVVDQAAEYDNKSTLSLIGVTSKSQAVRLANYMLYLNKYCKRTVSFQVAADGLIDQIGDVIWVQHDVPQWGYGGRLAAATENTVTLDQEVTLSAENSYRITIRLEDGTVVERSVVAEDATSAILTVSTPFDSVPGEHVVYTFGQVTQDREAFRIVAIERGGEDLTTFKITALEYNESVFNCDTETPVLEESATALSPPQVTGLTLSEDLVRQGDRYQARLIINWVPPADYGGVRAFIRIDDGPEQVHAVDLSRDWLAVAVPDGSRGVVQVAAVSSLGVVSPRAAAPTASRTVQGKTAPPADVTGLVAAPSLAGLTLSWNPIGDIDLDAYVIRHAPETTGALWHNATEIGRTTGTAKTFHAAQSGTYLVKAVDTSGIHSENAAWVATTLPATFNWNVTETQSGGTGAWTDGIMTDVWENQNDKLQLGGAGAWDDMNPLDDVADVNMYGGVVSEGYYTFEVIDLGSVQDCRITTQAAFAADDYDDRLDDWAAVNDQASWDAIVNDVGCALQVRTRDDPAADWSVWTDVWTTDVTARLFQFRGRLWTNDAAHTPTATLIQAQLDMPDRVESGQESVSSGGESVSFSRPFMRSAGPQIIGVQVVDGAAGDYAEATNKNTTSFTLKAYDAGGNPKAADVAWRAVGY